MIKLSEKSVLDSKEVKPGKEYMIGELPAGVLVDMGGSKYQTIVQPKSNFLKVDSKVQVWCLGFNFICDYLSTLPAKVLKVF